MNTDVLWPDLEEAEHQVLVMQKKLHRWAVADPGRRFDDLANLVYDPAFLVVAHAHQRLDESLEHRTQQVRLGRSRCSDTNVDRSIVLGSAVIVTISFRLIYRSSEGSRDGRPRRPHDTLADEELMHHVRGLNSAGRDSH